MLKPIPIILTDDCHGHGQASVEVKIYPNNVSLRVPGLANDDSDGVPVVIEQHNGHLRLLLYVDDMGMFHTYPTIIYLT